MGREQSRARDGLGALRARFAARGVRGAGAGSPDSAVPADAWATLHDGTTKPASRLVKGDVVVVSAGGMIPADGIVIEGVAMVEESGITGESAPVIRESGTERSAVSAGTHVLTSQLVIAIT